MIVVLCGGFGAARFVEGLAAFALELHCVVNVGDDFDYVGLRVCPDLDSVLYALAGRFDEGRGWGPVDDSFHGNDELVRYGDAWFRLGDRDAALCMKRTALLREGWSLSVVTAELAAAGGITASLQPVTDDPVPTVVRTPQGPLALQDFLVRHRAGPEVVDVVYDGAAAATPAPGVLAAIEQADLLVVAPSNPISSIGAILAVPGLRDAIAARRRPNVAVSPVVQGVEPGTRAERGRFAVRQRFMATAGLAHRPSAVAARYRDLIDGFVLDRRDEETDGPLVAEVGLPTLAADLLPPRGPARAVLATRVVDFGTSLPVVRSGGRRASPRVG